MSQRVAIILAAGASSRMNTKMAKVLHEVCGRPMLSYVLDACRQAGVDKMYIVVGFGADQVKERFSGAEDIIWVMQEEQKGTAHAVLCCKEHLADFDGETLVICSDMPLVRGSLLQTLIDTHEKGRSAMTLATAILDDPSGYGRISRDSYGNIQAIVEHNDCTEEQLSINEVNPSYYLFDNQSLFKALGEVRPNNIKQEYYITDVLSIIQSYGQRVLAVTAVQPEEAMGVNSRQQLSEASKIMQHRIQRRLMEQGVTIVDPDNTWIDSRAEIGQDTQIEPFTYIHGEVKIGRGCRIGPFAYLRDDTVVENDVVLGVFTEVKNSHLSDGVRARHHSYIGNATVGENVNVGAGSITANFDGKNINETHIGKNSYLGSGSILVAPLDIKEGTNIKPGSVVSQKDLEAIGSNRNLDAAL